MRKQHDDFVLSLRLPAQDAERLTHAARARGITISAMARLAIMRGLTSTAGTWLSYGAPSGAPLSLSLVGNSLPATRTVGGLSLDNVFA